MLSDRKEDYIAMIQGLSPNSQTEMMNILNEVLFSLLSGYYSPGYV